MNKNSFERAKWIPICIIAVLLMIIYKTLDNFSQITSAISGFVGVISPLIYGILFAYFFYIPHQKIEKLYKKSKFRFIAKRARIFSTLSIFLLLILLIVLIIIIFLPILIANIIDLANSIPVYINSVLDYFDDVPEDSIWASFNIAGFLRESSGGLVNQYINLSTIEQVARGIISFAGEIFSLLLGLIVSLYLLLERGRIIEFVKRASSVLIKSEKLRDRLQRYVNHINKVLFSFIASKGLDSIINIVAVTVILLIFNVPHAFLLGIIAGLFNFIPYLGSLIAVILITLITVITGGLGKAIQVLIPLMVFQQLDGNFIEPRIMKSSLKISPILVIIAVVVGGAYFGVLGMFLAVPIAVIIKQLLLDYINNSEQKEIT